MSSRFTMVLAGLFLLGAVIAGYWGLVLGRQPEEPVVAVVTPVATPVQEVVEKAKDEMRKPVLVLRRDVPAYTTLTAEDLVVEHLLVAPTGSYTTPEQVVGRSTWRALPAGSWLDDQSFDAGGPVARMIRPGERAVAIAVDEVIGASGQVRPGDYVDVLVFLRSDTNNPQQSAQVALPALRLLSFGDALGLANDGKPAAEINTDAETEKSKGQRPAPARTAVVAVPEVLVSRLMLASQAGSLRLAVRSADEKNLASYWAGEQQSKHLETADRQLYRFNQLSLSAPQQASTTIATAAKPHGMVVIRGIQVDQKTP